MRKSEQGLLVTHVGSLPRGARLNELLIRAELGEGVASAELEAEVERRVAHVFGQQRDLGIDICNDGEQGRVGFQTYVAQRMAGFGGQSNRRRPRDMTDFPDYGKLLAERFPRRGKQFNAPQAVAEVRYRDTTAIDAEVARLARHAKAAGRDPADCFMTAPSPGIISSTLLNAHYANHEDYVFALAREMRNEYAAITKAGFVLQIDAPDLAMDRTIGFQDNTDSEFLATCETHVAAINRAIEGLPAERVRLHCCWGNWEGPHTNDIPFASVLPVLEQAKVGSLSVEFGNPRHQHEAEVLRGRRLPDRLILVAGVIDTTTNFVEHPEVVAKRLLEIVDAVGDRERVIASTDCGFGTFAGREWVAEDVVWAKLGALCAGADIATARLWGHAPNKRV
ncbi:MAG TPA: cobalamin-independent methionine synthase II family protein [Xanthobacteraceae bacterium]|nr:cobalamin-independent methionine synthase II family protein [Xanthobacteraceae bacterium]